MTARLPRAPRIDRRRFMFSALLAGGVLCPEFATALGPQGQLRFGLTAVVIRENLKVFNKFREYLTLRLGRPVEFVRRRSYADILELLRQGGLEAAWICGYPFVQPRSPEYLDLLVAPVYAGAPLYRSLIIVPAESPVERFQELEGAVFAYSDPDSNSGYIVPRATLRESGFDPDRFFRFTFFTYSHAETVLAVSERVADGGAVDSYVYDMLGRYSGEIAAGTRVIHRSAKFGFPPMVTRRGLEPGIRIRLRDALVAMRRSADGSQILAALGLDGFTEVSPALYDPIREIAVKAGRPLKAEEASGG